MVRVDRNGGITVVRPDTLQYTEPRVSPAGTKVVMTVVSPDGATDLWVHTMTGTSSRFTTDGASRYASWSPDGRRIAWNNGLGSDGLRSGGGWSPSDGSGAREAVFDHGVGMTWAPDGSSGFLITTSPVTGANIERVSLEKIPTSPIPFINTPATETAPKVAPDGKWLAFVSNGSGRAEVYVCSTSDPANVRQVSTHGADEPVWAPNGREPFYRDGRKLIAVAVETTGGFVIVRRDTLFTDTFQRGNNYAAYDVMPDGQSFIFVKPIGAGALPTYVFSWFDELRERMRTRK